MEKYTSCGVLAVKNHDDDCHAPASNGGREVKFSLLFGEGEPFESESMPDADAQEITEAVDIQGEDSEEEKRLRAEYRELIKTKFKKFYTEDTQRMLNRRFRKYREMTEGAKAEDSEKGSAAVDLATKGAEQAPDKVTEAPKEVKPAVPTAPSFRPPENGNLHTANPKRRGVKSLSKSERAEMARRAMKGEKIVF